jgi:hypothetical protein
VVTSLCWVVGVSGVGSSPLPASSTTGGLGVGSFLEVFFSSFTREKNKCHF